MQAEYGSSSKCRFLDESNVTLYNSENEEIAIPKCEVCNIHMTLIIGEHNSAFICANCKDKL
jgi:hypothetical protein